MMKMKAGSVVLLTAVLISSLTACSGGSGAKPVEAGGASTPSPAAETNEAYARASELFQKTNCISCHGVNLEGKAGPKTNLQKIGASRSPEQIAGKIENGGGGMPVYKSKLTQEEIHLLADWLSSKK